MMRWHELTTLHDEGHEIGSHSRSHAILPLATTVSSTTRSRLAELLEPSLASRSVVLLPERRSRSAHVQAVGVRAIGTRLTTRYGVNAPGTHRFRKRVDMQGAHARDHRGKLSAGRVLLRLTGQLRGVLISLRHEELRGGRFCVGRAARTVALATKRRVQTSVRGLRSQGELTGLASRPRKGVRARRRSDDVRAAAAWRARRYSKLNAFQTVPSWLFEA